jgi:hypothetical protein
MGNQELKDLNPDASLGLEHARSGAYVVFVTEKLAEGSEKDYEEFVLKLFETDNEAKSHEKSKVKLGDMEVTRHHYAEVPVGTVKIDFFLVATAHEGVGCQITGWCLHGRQKDVLKEINAVYSGFSWLAKEKKEALRKELIKLADEGRSVSETECYRNRRYSDFEFGFSLSLPKGFWTHLVGEEARFQNEDASLMLSNLDHELYVTVILEEGEGYTAKEYHAVVLEALEPPEGVKTETVKSNDIEILSTRFSMVEGGQPLTYHLATTSDGKKHVQVLMYGIEGNLKNTQKFEMDIIKSMQLSKDTVKESKTLADGSYENHRLGFKVTPPDKNWPIVDITPRTAKAVGSLALMKESGKNSVLLAGAVHTDVTDMTEFITDMLRRAEPFKRANLEVTSEESIQWLESEGKRLKIEATEGVKKMSVEFVGVTLGGTFFFTIMYSENPDISIEKLRDCFKLIP